MDPLHYASINGHHECMKILLDYKPDVNEKDNDGRSALDKADNNTKAFINKYLQESIPDIKKFADY
jgi:ankyrin repeat protein